ncbi:MAG: hypothetical protein AAGG68_30340 [Bacteroidota bacterium]
MKPNNFVRRKKERAVLEEASQSDEAEMVAVIGISNFHHHIWIENQ